MVEIDVFYGRNQDVTSDPCRAFDLRGFFGRRFLGLININENI
jgi:hypothetical protein